MGKNYTFSPGDPIVLAAFNRDLVDMYSRLNAGPMYDILKQLEALREDKQLDLMEANRAKHFDSIDRSPIFKERMKVAVAAVLLSGRLTAIAFQREYEAYLNMLPKDQRSDVLTFLATREPAHSEKVENLFAYTGPFFPLPWTIVTSSGQSASWGYWAQSSGFIYLMHSDSPDEIYRLFYTGFGVGKSISKRSATYSTKEMPSGGIGRLYRTGSRAADVGERSFGGLGYIVTVSATVSPKPTGLPWGINGNLSLLCLGLNGTFGDYDDVKKVPQKAGAVGMLYGRSTAASDKRGDAGISWQAINVGSITKVRL